MSWVWENGPDAQGDLLILLALADFADDEGKCWPSMASVAKKARMEERSARRAIRRLQERGWLSCEAGQGGRSKTNVYRVNTVKPGHSVPVSDDKPGPTNPGLESGYEAETRTLVTETRTLVPLNPDPRVPRTIIEPSIEPSEEKEGARKRTPRGSRLPEDWQLPREWGEWAVSRGWEPDEVIDEAETFRDYWISQPGQKGVKLDWGATWRTWVKRSQQYRNQGTKRNGRNEQVSITERLKAKGYFG